MGICTSVSTLVKASRKLRNICHSMTDSFARSLRIVQEGRAWIRVVPNGADEIGDIQRAAATAAEAPTGVKIVETTPGADEHLHAQVSALVVMVSRKLRNTRHSMTDSFARSLRLVQEGRMSTRVV